MNRLNNRVAVVTGGGSGIGAATAHRFALEGAAVVVGDINVQSAEAVAKSILAEGGRAIVIAGDVTKRSDVREMIQSALDVYGRLDVLFNNAGIGLVGPLSTLTDADIDRIIDINIKGVIHGMAVAAPIMLGAGQGCIINSSSSGASFGTPSAVVYCGSKGAVVSLTRAAAMEYAPTVRVNAICPGATDTGMFERTLGRPLTPAMKKALLRRYPLGRMARPEEIAAAVAFLASDDASYMTGAALAVDGGMTAGGLLQLEE